MDLIRSVLLRVEAAPAKLSWKSLVQGMDEAEAQRVPEHLKLLDEAGLIKSMPIHIQGLRLPEDIELTWPGHDFVDAVRDPIIWGETKEGAEKAEGFTFELLKALARGFIKKQIEDRTGVKLDISRAQQGIRQAAPDIIADGSRAGA